MPLAFPSPASLSRPSLAFPAPARSRAAAVQELHVDPDRSSRVAARRIVDEVLADHAARATALDGAKPVTVVERPDTPSWRAARRIVEETLAEHAARSVVPRELRLDVVVDLDERDVEVVVDLDGHAPAAEAPGEVVTVEPSEPAVVNVVAPIEPDETPAKGARRVVEGVLTEQEIDPDAPTDPRDAPTSFEIDPVPAALPEPPEPVTTEAEAAVVPVAVEPSGTEDAVEPDRADDPGPAEAEVVEVIEGDENGPTQVGGGPVAGEVDGEVGPVDDERLRAAIPEWLFAPKPEPIDDVAIGDDVAIDGSPVQAERDAASPVDGPPAAPTPEPVPPARLDPDAPVAIAARIVAGVLADRERAAQDAQDAQDARDADVAALGAELAGSEPSGRADAHVPDAGTDAGSVTGPVAPEGPEAQPSGVPEGWAVMPSASERGTPGSPSGVMTVDTDVEDPVVDPEAPDTRVDGLPASESDAFWGQEAVAPAAEDEFGAWPDPIAPPRRTGRWLITTVLGALLLALLLPLAIGALRDLVSFS